jgi:hypothetical protein
MKTLLKSSAIFAVLTLNAWGATISVAPTTGSVNVGGNLSVNVNVAGLTTGTAPALGAFQLDFLFDNTLLTFSNVTFGSQLSLNGTPSLNGFFSGVGSAASVFESSFNTTSELETGQLDSFLLFTITFSGAASGVSPLSLTNLIMADANSTPNDITNTFSVSNSSVQVTDSTVSPEPGTIVLVASGIGLLLRTRLRNSSRTTLARDSWAHPDNT